MLALRPDAVDEIDRTLLAMGRERFIALALPHWNVALDVIEDTDLVLTVASQAARGLMSHRAMRSFEPPLPLAGLSYHHAWHVMSDADLGHSWLRRVIATCVGHSGPVQEEAAGTGGR